MHWSLEGDGDLNVNLAHLDPGSQVAAHVNREVDVVLIVLGGTGRLLLDTVDQELVAHVLVHAARGTERSIVAGPDGLTYLSLHRSRGPLGITSAPKQPGRGRD